MSIAVAPDTAEAFVRRLLATEDASARRAIRARASLEGDAARAAATLLLSEAEHLLGVDPRRMEQICLDAMALAETAGDEFLQAMALMRYGDALRAEGRNADACRAWDEAHERFLRLNRPVEAARTRIGWVMAAANLGRVSEALRAARRARQVLASHGQEVRVASLDGNVGSVYLEQGRYGAALRHFTQAYHLFQELGDGSRLNAARCHANQGLSLVRLSRHRRALLVLDEVRREYKALGQTAGFARTTRSMGLAQTELGNYRAALGSFEEAAAAFRSLDLSAEAVWVARDRADCYLALNRPSDALAALDTVNEDLKRVDNVQDAFGITTRRIAAHLALGDTAEALRLLDQADARFPTSAAHERAWLATRRAAALLRNGDEVAALAATRHARALAHVSGARGLATSSILTEAATLHRLGDLAQAGRLAAWADRLARRLDSAPLRHRSQTLLGLVAESQSRPAVARRRYHAAIVQLEREQAGVIFEFRESFAADRGAAYERLALLQLRSGDAAAAFATAERGKSRALADAISGAVAPRPRGGSATRRLARELARAREDYAAAFARALRDGEHVDGRSGGGTPAVISLSSMEAAVERLAQRLQLAAAPEQLDSLDGALATPALPELPPGIALLEYFSSGDDLLRFWLDASGVCGDVIEAAAPQVERLLRVFRLNLEAAERGAPERRDTLAPQARIVLARLHALLLGGLEQRLAACAGLVVVPHGPLHGLPFHALYDGALHLIERLPVSYAPSAALYSICQARSDRRRRGPALVLASSSAGRLPFAVQEGSAVGAVLHAPVYRDGEATRTLLEESGRRARLIHIAAEGCFRPDAPLFSRIELADGPLTAADVFDLDLRAALVTLSACETGRAVVGGGDELAGLVRAFLYAGAASLLVSQWRVGDASTATLMARFYRELKRGAGRAEALRRAQIAAIRETTPQTGPAHPFIWAGFQLIGADRRL